MAENYEYTTINGRERYNQVETNDYIVDFKQFIVEGSNEITFNLVGTMKLLPYDGFYPQERTKQIAGLFNDVYLDNNEISNEQKYGSKEQIIEANNKILTITQPLFAPGILFNTIKAGIAVDWPVRIIYSSNDTEFEANLYISSSEQTNYRIEFDGDNEEALTSRIPFEALLDPEIHYLKAFGDRFLNNETHMFYLNPTHHDWSLRSKFAPTIYLNRNYPSCSYNYFKDIMPNVSRKEVYKSAISNFLYETVNFFLENGELTTFKSNEYNQDVKIGVKANTRYSMNIKLKKSVNFSMFNRNIKNTNVDDGISSTLIIPSASLFGPPVDDEENGNKYNNNSMYYPFSPPYFLPGEEDSIQLYFETGDVTEYTLEEIVRSILSVVTDLEGSNNSSAINHAMRIESCLNRRSITTSEDGKKTWVIKTKFETPLINFDKCSYVSGSIKEYLGSY